MAFSKAKVITHLYQSQVSELLVSKITGAKIFRINNEPLKFIILYHKVYSVHIYTHKEYSFKSFNFQVILIQLYC